MNVGGDDWVATDPYRHRSAELWWRFRQQRRAGGERRHHARGRRGLRYPGRRRSPLAGSAVPVQCRRWSDGDLRGRDWHAGARRSGAFPATISASSSATRSILPASARPTSPRSLSIKARAVVRLSCRRCCDDCAANLRLFGQSAAATSPRHELRTGTLAPIRSLDPVPINGSTQTAVIGRRRVIGASARRRHRTKRPSSTRAAPTPSPHRPLRR